MWKSKPRGKILDNEVDKVLSLFVENSAITVEAFYDSLCLREQLQRGLTKNGIMVLNGIGGGFGICRSAVIKGSESHELLLQFMNASQELFQKRSAMTKAHR